MPSLFPDYFSGTMSDEAMVSEQPTGGKKKPFLLMREPYFLRVVLLLLLPIRLGPCS